MVYSVINLFMIGAKGLFGGQPVLLSANELTSQRAKGLFSGQPVLRSASELTNQRAKGLFSGQPVLCRASVLTSRRTKGLFSGQYVHNIHCLHTLDNDNSFIQWSAWVWYSCSIQANKPRQQPTFPYFRKTSRQTEGKKLIHLSVCARYSRNIRTGQGLQLPI